MNFDAVALAGTKLEYIVMSDFTEHDGQNQIPLKIPVQMAEIAEKKVVHNDRHGESMLILKLRIKRWRRLPIDLIFGSHFNRTLKVLMYQR